MCEVGTSNFNSLIGGRSSRLVLANGEAKIDNVRFHDERASEAFVEGSQAVDGVVVTESFHRDLAKRSRSWNPTATQPPWRSGLQNVPVSRTIASGGTSATLASNRARGTRDSASHANAKLFGSGRRDKTRCSDPRRCGGMGADNGFGTHSCRTHKDIVAACERKMSRCHGLSLGLISVGASVWTDARETRRRCPEVGVFYQ